MIRKAVQQDIQAVGESYRELLIYENKHGSNSNWVLDLYPTEKTAQGALEQDTLYVLEEDGCICGSMILNQLQAPEYDTIPWMYPAEPKEVLVVHTLCIPPSQAGHGYGKAMVGFTKEQAVRQGCKVIRLDTWVGNQPAAGLYRSLGFRLSGSAAVMLQGVIPEEQIFFEYPLT